MGSETICVATYALRNLIRDPEKGMNSVIDFLHEQEISQVEINNIFIKPETLINTARLFEDQGIKPIQLTVDGNNFFQKKPSARKTQFEYMKKWIDPAHEAGITTIRANMGRPLGLFKKTDTLENLVATFKPIFEYTERLGMNFVFENHGGKSSDVDFQLAVKKEFPSPKMGFLLDTGNYKPKSAVYENILKLGKSILAVHAKTYAFDENGEETQLDFGKIIENLRKIGYTGYYSVEYEGALPDEEGTAKTIALLRKYLQ